MRTFREIILEGFDIKKLEKAFNKKELESFLDSLTFYIDYNDEQSKKEILSYINEMKKAGLITKPSKVFRMVRIEKKDLKKKIKERELTSSSTEKVKGKMIGLMKKMIEQYKQKGDFYYLEIEDAEGFDVNSFADLFHRNKEYFLTNYDNKIMAFFYDTIENKSEQKEFLIFGKYSVATRESI